MIALLIVLGLLVVACLWLLSGPSFDADAWPRGDDRG